MIYAEKGRAEAQGKLVDLIFEFDEIMRLMILNHPELVQAVCNIRGEDILNADVNPLKYAVAEDMIRNKKEMEESGEYDD